jgi:hypothetical protein
MSAGHERTTNYNDLSTATPERCGGQREHQQRGGGRFRNNIGNDQFRRGVEVVGLFDGGEAPAAAFAPANQHPVQAEIRSHRAGRLIRVRLAGDVEPDPHLRHDCAGREGGQIELKQAARTGIFVVGAGDQGGRPEIRVGFVLKQRRGGNCQKRQRRRRKLMTKQGEQASSGQLGGRSWLQLHGGKLRHAAVLFMGNAVTRIAAWPCEFGVRNLFRAPTICGKSLDEVDRGNALDVVPFGNDHRQHAAG